MTNAHRLSLKPVNRLKPWWLSCKESACNARNAAGTKGLIPGLGRFFGKGNGNLLQYSCLENLMDRGTWQAIVHGVAKESDMTQQLKRTNWKRLKWFLVFMAFGTFLVAQGIGVHLPVQGTRVWSPVQGDPTKLRATKLMCHNHWACALEPKSHNYRVWVLWSIRVRVPRRVHAP